MDPALPTIGLTSLAIAFAPSALLLVVMRRWSLAAGEALYANGRMLVQLLAMLPATSPLGCLHPIATALFHPTAAIRQLAASIVGLS